MYKRVLKCSVCGNVSEFEYLGSRNVNKNGEIMEIVGNEDMWMSYFKCPKCGSIEVEFHPVGQKPDIPDGELKEVAIEKGDIK